MPIWTTWRHVVRLASSFDLKNRPFYFLCRYDGPCSRRLPFCRMHSDQPQIEKTHARCAKDVGDWKVYYRLTIIAAHINNRTFREDLTVDQQESLLAAQQELLGPRELRSNEGPTINNLTKEREGGAAIERSCQNSDRNRSHTLGPSREKNHQNCNTSGVLQSERKRS